MKNQQKEVSPKVWLGSVCLFLFASLTQIGLAIGSTGPDPDHSVMNLRMLSGSLGLVAAMLSCWPRMQREKKSK